MESLEQRLWIAHRDEGIACLPKDPLSRPMVSRKCLDVGGNFSQAHRVSAEPTLSRDLDATPGERSGKVEIAQACMHVGESMGDSHPRSLDRRVLGPELLRTTESPR